MNARETVLAAAILLGACSVVQDFSAATLTCDAHDACAKGYSCMRQGEDGLPACVRDGTLRAASVCAEDRQCAGANVCARGRCETACNPTGWLGVDACPPGSICIGGSQDDPRPVCAPSDPCIRGALCATAGVAQGVCVALGRPDAQACLPRCDILWRDGGYTDTCETHGACQPVGAPPALVCLPDPPAPTPLPGAPCDLGANRCGAGHACIGSRCVALCDVTRAAGVQTCGGHHECCPQREARGGVFGVCRTSC